MLIKGWSEEMFASIQIESLWLTRHVDLAQLAREAREERGGSAFTLTQRGEHSGGLPPDHRAFIHLLEAAEEPDITDFMKTYQEDDQLNTWMGSEFPMTQPELDITIESYF